MIRDVTQGADGRIEIGPGESSDQVDMIDLEEAIGDVNVMIDYFHDEPRLYVYDDREEPAFKIRFPTDANDIDRPEVIYE